MHETHAIFENFTDSEVSVFPQTPYNLKFHTFKVTIKPESHTWHLGIRFSSGEPTLFDNAKAQQDDVTADILISGTHHGVTIRQYNISAGKVTLFQQATSVLNKTIELTIQKKEESYQLSFTKGLAGRSVNVTLKNDLDFFQLFANRVKSRFKVRLSVSAALYSNALDVYNDVSIFQVGSLIFWHGDMFDYGAIKTADIIILPASSNGTISQNIANRAAELRIPNPPKKPLGSLKLFEKTINDKKVFAGYGYSVKDNKSSPEVIEQLCSAIKEESFKIPKQNDRNKLQVNVPLLGTGAGRLNALTVAEIYDKHFSGWDHGTILVAVQTHHTFDEIFTFLKPRISQTFDLPVKPKPNNIERIEKELGFLLTSVEYDINPELELTGLYLSDKKLPNLEFLRQFPHIQSLTFNRCHINDFFPLGQLESLRSLYITNQQHLNTSFIWRLPHLTTLDLSNNNIENVEFLTELENLKFVTLRNNRITFLPQLRNLTSVEHLDLSENILTDIEPLSNLSSLSYLNVSENRIESIRPLADLANLTILEAHTNSLLDLSTILLLPKLEFLRVENNPVVSDVGILLSTVDNHLPPIKNFLLRQSEDNKEILTLPAKVLLLGNHAAGKSSLLSLLLDGRISQNVDSTHIIAIEKYPKNSSQIPEIIFFDFGGQDYYHGIYRAFLSGGALYLILWNASTNQNKQRSDINRMLTQDFTVDYWLSQKTYLENEKFDGSHDETLLIQTFADINPRISTFHSQPEYSVANTFYLSLSSEENPDLKFKKVNDLGLQYIRSTILAMAENKRPSREEPQWYIDFIRYILRENSQSDHRPKPIQDIKKHYHPTRRLSLERLQDDLVQLHRQGLALYYKEEMPETAWLNPAALATYIHQNVLKKKDLVKHKGVVTKDFFANVNDDILKLLCLQKIVFEHKTSKGTEFIVPNFLPLVNDSISEYHLLTFGFSTPTFCLKFERFLPFGLINQLVCFFGKLPDEKIFWRDQLLFTLNQKAKILININFSTLEIRVFCSFKDKSSSVDRGNIISYIFFGIMSMYWDMKDVLDFDDFLAVCNKKLMRDDFPPDSDRYRQIENCENIFEKPQCRPLDLFISLGDRYFINYEQLCRIENEAEIEVKVLRDNNDFENVGKSMPVYQFQPFTSKPLKRRKRVVISYSKQDLELVDKFRQHLVPLYQDGLIEDPWYCTMLVAGSEWDVKIQKEFDEADIIFFMISENLMSTKYVIENEIKNAVDKSRQHGTISIVPIILQPYHWTRNNEYNLGKFTALPYMLKPVTEFKNHNQAWEYISDAIRIMIELGNEAMENSDHFTPRMKAIQKAIIRNEV